MRAVAAALVFVGSAAAQHNYVAAYLGGAWTRDATVRVDTGSGTSLTFSGVRLVGRSFESPVYYGVRAGRFLGSRLGFEAEFIHLKVHADLDHPVRVEGRAGGSEISERAPMSQYMQQFEVSHGLNLLLGNMVFRQALTEGGRVRILIRAGAGPTILHPETVILGEASRREYRFGPLAVQSSAAVEARLWRGLHVFGEYKYTYTPTRFDIPGGEARFRAASQHLVSGLGVYF